MPTHWKTFEIFSQLTAAADLVLVSTDPLTCWGYQTHFERVLGATEATRFGAELGQRLDIVPTADGLLRVLALGIGPNKGPLSLHRWLSVGGFLVEAMTDLKLDSVRLPLSEAVGGSDVMEAILLGVFLHSFRSDMASNSEKRGFAVRGVVVAQIDIACAEQAMRCAGPINRARAWVQMPANLLPPPVWAEEARDVFSSCKAVVRILGSDELEELGANALLAVGRGSEHGARLFVAEWRGDPARNDWDVVLVGKGLTFDSGGINLKSKPTISKMSFDMAGGASVLGALELAIARRSRTNVVAIVPMVENMVDARAYRPGDVVTSMAGLTIEVANTDAEGRLVLADAITYGVKNYSPAWIVDAATLTGLVTGVLHEEFAAMYCSDDQLASDLLEAGEAVGDRVWRMPLDPSQDYIVDSEFADVSNLGAPGLLGYGTGSPAAGAKFLEKFARGARWAHIDMAGTAWSTRRTFRGHKGATGYGVRLLDRWMEKLEERAGRGGGTKGHSESDQ